MKKQTHILIKSAQVAFLSVFLINAGINAQDAFAGSNSTGQPSGTTLAGSSTTPPASVSGLTAIMMGGAGPTASTTTTTTNGVTTTTKTVTLNSSSLTDSFNAVGLSVPSNGETTTFAGESGTYTVTNQGDTATVIYSMSPNSVLSTGSGVITSGGQSSSQTILLR